MARRLRAARVGFGSRRTMSNDSGPYDAVVIGGGVFENPGILVQEG